MYIYAFMTCTYHVYHMFFKYLSFVWHVWERYEPKYRLCILVISLDLILESFGQLWVGACRLTLKMWH